MISVLLLATRTYGPHTLVCKITDKRIDESSGIAACRSVPGTYYTHNDSGDTARFFRFDLKGNVLGEWSLPGITATDWEDMASARWHGKNWLFLGDIGDNNAKRKEIQIYRMEEPGKQEGAIAKFTTFHLTFPDKAHNCETLMVDPATLDIYLVTKVNKGTSGVYRLPYKADGGTYMLEKLGEVNFDSGIPFSALTTGGDVSPDGQHLVVRTYTAAFEFDCPKGKFSTWITVKPRRIDLRLEPQGEAVGYSLDGKNLVTTSEGKPCEVSQLAINP